MKILTPLLTLNLQVLLQRISYTVDNSPNTLLENAQNKCSVISRESDVSSNEKSLKEAEIKEENEDESHDIIVDPNCCCCCCKVLGQCS